MQQFNQFILVMEENMIVIKDPKNKYFDFDWSKGLDKNLKHRIEFIMKSNMNLKLKMKQKMRLNNYCQNKIMETTFMNTENSKAIKLHKFAFNLSED